MSERRTLIEGLKATPPPVDTKVEADFVYGAKALSQSAAKPATSSPVQTQATNRSPISTRIRSEFATALKRASLERQLSGQEPNTLQDILEEAIEPWLRSNGYLP
jgi:hypothetical protein